jgi:teichuronic acid biosynthesis glycosyltransferase TuaC
MAGLGMPEERITVHYTGVELDRFRPVDRAAAKARLGVDGPLLVSAGALIPRKGQAVTIAALEHIPQATLILVGEGPDRPMLERQVAAGRADRSGAPPGVTPAWRLPELLAAADVMVLPSSSEGLANVWVEALACGTPIIITDVGGARELLRDDSAGRIVAREPEAIAAAAVELLADPPAADLVRRAAEPFTWDRNSEALHRHLAAVAATPA